MQYPFVHDRHDHIPFLVFSHITLMTLYMIFLSCVILFRRWFSLFYYYYVYANTSAQTTRVMQSRRSLAIGGPVDHDAMTVFDRSDGFLP